MKSSTLYTLLALFLVAPLFAQEGAQKEMPEGQKKLNLFLGTWSGPGSYEMGGQTMDFEMHLIGESIIDGKAIEWKQHASLGNMGMYKEKDFIAWDYLQSKVTLFAVSNMGEVGQYSGNWVEGEAKNVLKLSGVRTDGKDKWETQQTITFKSENTMTWTAVSTKNGEPEGVYKATLTKE